MTAQYCEGFLDKCQLAMRDFRKQHLATFWSTHALFDSSNGNLTTVPKQLEKH